MICYQIINLQLVDDLLFSCSWSITAVVHLSAPLTSRYSQSALTDVLTWFGRDFTAAVVPDMTLYITRAGHRHTAGLSCGSMVGQYH